MGPMGGGGDGGRGQGTLTFSPSRFYTSLKLYLSLAVLLPNHSWAKPAASMGHFKGGEEKILIWAGGGKGRHTEGIRDKAKPVAVPEFL